MSDIPYTVLVVDDEEIARRNLGHVLTRQGYAVTLAKDGKRAVSELEKNEFDLVVTDLVMNEVDGLEVLKITRELWPDTEIIVVTGYPTIDTAIEAMRRGAYHYLAKPYNIEEARVLVGKALEKRRLRLDVRDLRERVKNDSGVVPVIGDSGVVQRLKKTVAMVAPSDSTVLILGETGTGKELVARTLHLLSRRSEGRFLAINCGAFNDELLENELFGHDPGGFSGANRLRKGLFESAPGGTLFLDEMGEMSTAMQVKLLRALQERVIHRVGGNDDIPVDVRIVAATNRDLKREVEAGRFRQDLYYRLNVITINVPSLSERRGDIPLLSQYFLDKAARRLNKGHMHVSPEVLGILSRYAFPGNVRELENIMERAAVMAESAVIEPAHLPPDLHEAPVRVSRPGFENPVTLEENEKRYISWVLERSGGNKTQAAGILDIDRVSLWRKIRKYKLE